MLPGCAPMLDPRCAVSSPISPGVYKTEPYSLLVRVPGPCPDDRSLIGGKASPPCEQMPIVRPDLRMVPWSPSRSDAGSSNSSRLN